MANAKTHIPRDYLGKLVYFRHGVVPLSTASPCAVGGHLHSPDSSRAEEVMQVMLAYPRLPAPVGWDASSLAGMIAGWAREPHGIPVAVSWDNVASDVICMWVDLI